MGNDRYIWCRNCGAIHHVTQFDRAPIYAFPDRDVQEIPANEGHDFMRRHAGHRLEPMRETGNDHYENGFAFDPMSIRYVEVSNGKDVLLLRRSRSSIAEPLGYEIINGQLIQSGVTLEVQDRAIRKEMKLHFRWAPSASLDDHKIDLFVELFQAVVRNIDPDAVRACEYSSTDDHICYGELDAAAVDALLTKCGERFSALELESVRRFVNTHREGCDVMALVKRRSMSVARTALGSANR
jgi:hypothetical protein